MGSCIRWRNSILIALSLARIRFLMVLRPMTNDPHLRDRVQKCVKPRKSNVSGFPSPRLSRCLAAWRPKRINRPLRGTHLTACYASILDDADFEPLRDKAQDALVRDTVLEETDDPCVGHGIVGRHDRLPASRISQKQSLLPVSSTHLRVSRFR